VSGFGNTIAIDAVKSTRGLGIIWNPKEINLYDSMETECALSATFHIPGTSIKGVITNVYGPFLMSMKKKIPGFSREN